MATPPTPSVIGPLGLNHYNEATFLKARVDYIWENIVDVKAFNAKGDGVTDDTNAIQNAIDRTTGKELYFPAGTYLISNSLIIKSTTTLKGDGNSSIIKLADLANEHMIVVSAKSDLLFFNLVLDGNKSNNSSNKDAIVGSDAKRVTVSQCVIKNTVGNGVSFTQGCEDIVLVNNRFTDNGEGSTGNGINLDAGAGTDTKRVTIQGNIINNPNLKGIHLKETNKATIIGNVIDATGAHAIEIFTCDNVNASLNSIDNIGGTMGISVANGSNRISVMGNTIENVSIGIECADSSDVTISANVINSPTVGISIDGNSILLSNVTVSNNVINTATEKGMGLVGDIDGLTISGNIIDGTTGKGIESSGASIQENISITNNIIKDSTKTGLDLKIPNKITIQGNIIQGNNTSNDAAERGIELESTHGSQTDLILSNNLVIDNLQGNYNARPIDITDGDTTPNISQGDFYKTTNTAPTIISALDGGIEGDEKTIIFRDNNTTIDFTGTTLNGNNNTDWTPANFDHMVCIFDGTNWYCNVSIN